MTSTYEFIIKTSKRSQMVDITGEIAGLVKQSAVSEGVCHVFVPHTTAGVTINENADPTVVTDMLAALDKLIPQDKNYLHREGNSDSHIKATLVGSSQSIFINNGRLLLGTWQGVYFCEFDGPRQRKVLVKILKQ